MSAHDPIRIIVTGDLVLDEPDGDHWLSGIAPALRGADLVIGHLEVPHAEGAEELAGDVPAPAAPPENLAALARAGFGMVSLAGNHIADCGARGIAETRAGLAAQNIAFTGAGADMVEASEPAIVTIKGWRVGFLSYNCVGPEAGWATDSRAGSNYLRVDTADGSPVAPAAPLAHVPQSELDRLTQDIAALRKRADIVLVALHKGKVHTPVLIEPYERALADAAMAGGADAVLGHHSHIVRGISFAGDRPIFHGLGNGCVVTSALGPVQDHPARREWAERRKRLFGFEPDPAYTLAPFHPEAVNAFMGELMFTGHAPVQTSIIAVRVEPPGRPVLAKASECGPIFRYVEAITEKAALPPIAIAANGKVAPA
ncbi:CapA family protein [Sphingopyxis indica]|uniref:CapA family protein n=1 Tax=Sphingopyxis indica TaxID=436663 RepID=UPI002938F775|nr:CapA family protein [Sphingopyxis indica]WOF42272.1 CapA family protein [Sphingopyxis indica]